jgi:hypothetical protein
MGFMEVSNEGECSVCLSGDKEMMQLSCEHVICVTCFLRRVASGRPHSGACLYVKLRVICDFIAWPLPCFRWRQPHQVLRVHSH